MLTFILSTSDEDSPDSDSLSEESELLSEESLSEESVSEPGSELESTVTLLTLPVFLDLFLDLRFLYLQLREL